MDKARVVRNWAGIILVIVALPILALISSMGTVELPRAITCDDVPDYLSVTEPEHYSDIWVQVNGIRHFLYDGDYPSFPTWTPDGSEITFVVYPATGVEIQTYNIEKGEIRTLVRSEDHVLFREPEWSPDGTKLAYISDHPDDPNIVYQYDITIISVDGHVLQTISKPNIINAEFSWSPDSSKLAFMSDWNGNFEIYFTDLMATVQLTDTGDLVPVYPYWLDDQRIRYRITQDDSYYVVNLSGDVEALSVAPKTVDKYWSPDGDFYATLNPEPEYGSFASIYRSPNVLCHHVWSTSEFHWRPES